MKATIATPNTQTLNSAEPFTAAQPFKLVEPALIKKKELARRLSISTRTIDDWAAKRMIPFIAVTPRLFLYEFDSVLTALKKHYQVEAAD